MTAHPRPQLDHDHEDYGSRWYDCPSLAPALYSDEFPLYRAALETDRCVVFTVADRVRAALGVAEGDGDIIAYDGEAADAWAEARDAADPFSVTVEG